MYFWWYILAIVRVLLTLWPQSGYIHPDEFFQSVEIAAGDFLEVDTLRTWEFNSSFPLRSIVPIFFISGPPLFILRTLEKAGIYGAVTPYAVLIMPRLMMLLLSFLLDLCTFRILEVLGWNKEIGLFLVASAYVTIVYYTRTFSNSVEGILFTVLLIQTLCQKSSVCDVQNKKEKSYSENISVFNVVLVIVIGFFNRPTFAAFAAFPFVYWLFAGTNQLDRFSCAKIVFRRSLTSLICAVFLTAFCVICDSVYFGHLSPDLSNALISIQSVGISRLLLQNLTVTPLNFLLYNMQTRNLADHGLHPTYTHVLANIQILFCMLGILVWKDLIKLTISVFGKTKSTVNHLAFVILLSVLFPLLFLSVFPHQEPRFLLPLLCPLITLSSNAFSGKKSGMYLKVLWIIFNICGCIFFGFFHQGGILPAINKIHTDIVKAPAPQSAHVIFWRTYMPPRHLFLHRNAPLFKAPLLQVHDLAGASKEQMIKVLKSLEHSSKGDAMFLICPGTVHHEVVCFEDLLKVEVLDQFWPHFSGEDMPSADQILCRNKEEKECKSNCSHSITRGIYNSLSLYLYSVSFNI